MNTDYFSNKDWLLDRKGRFTSSMVHKLFTGGRAKADLFGAGAMTYIYEKAAEVLTGEVKEEVNFAAAEYAHAMEPYAVAAYERQTGMKGEHFGASNPKFFPKGEREGSSPDWICEELQHGAEIKTPFTSQEHVRILTKQTMADLKADEKTKAYYHQVQHQLHIFGWKTWDLVSYDERMTDPKMRLKIIRCTPSPDWKADWGIRLHEATRILLEICFGPQETPIIQEPKIITSQINQPVETDDRPSL